MKKSHDYDLGKIEGATNGGLDAFFASEPQIVTPQSQAKTASAPLRRKVGSLEQLKDFQRIASDTLVHKSTQDLWALRREGESFVIERLFQDNGQPLKG